MMASIGRVGWSKDQTHTVMKTLALTSIFALTTWAATAQTTQNTEYRSIPQKCKWQDVQVVPRSVNVGGHDVRFTSLPKTAERKNMADLTTKELKRLKKQASRARCCTIVVDDDYHIPAQVKNPDREQEARLQQEILITFVQPMEVLQPCP